MKPLASLLVLVAIAYGTHSVQGASIVCPSGTRLSKKSQNKIIIEACVRRVNPCPSNEGADLAVSEPDRTGTCELSHGKTRFENPDGSEFVLNYVEGKLNGKAVGYSSQKIKLSEENYRAGLKEGKQETFYPDGKKKTEDHYSSGVKNGEQISWFDRGELEKHIQFNEGRPSGTWTFWYQNGHKKREYIYGALGWEGLYRDWYSNGRIHVAAQFLNGQLEGTYSIYYSNGKPMSERRYTKGVLEGSFDEWAITGDKVSSSHYQGGKFKKFIKAPTVNSSHSEQKTLPEELSTHLKADLDGNGYLDDILSSGEFPNQTKILLNSRDETLKEIMVPQSNLEIYSARTTEGQFGEPATVRDGLVAWGKGKRTKIFLYDFETESFEESSYPSDMDI